jgi:hypothetical protein
MLQVSCLALSKSGRYLASGQITYMGFTADIIIWDLETRQLMHRMALHKVRPAVEFPAPAIVQQEERQRETSGMGVTQCMPSTLLRRSRFRRWTSLLTTSTWHPWAARMTMPW